MPIYQVDIQVKSNNIYTSSVYHVLAADMATAGNQALAIGLIHANALPPTYQVVAVRASTPTKFDKVFVTYPVLYAGTRSVGGQDMPQWNRFLASFSVGPTYQCRKFLQGPTEGDQVDGGVLPATTTQLQTVYINPLIALGYLCNDRGDLFIAGVTKPYLVMRQLRRRKKRPDPVFSF